MESAEYKYQELTRKIIGCAMKVHRYFGPGFPEVVYQRALRIELDKICLAYLYEFEKDIFYDQLIAKRRLDLLVENKVLLELKATSEIEKKDYNQIINYLRVFRMEVGLLLNFGSASLQYKRFVNSFY